jgi:hypothetical protein
MRTAVWGRPFRLDLTEPERQLCAWVAREARAGRRRLYYEDAKASLDIRGEAELTGVLRGIRERVDDIHDMIHSPIVNTAVPYFDLGAGADHIWDGYCRAEDQETDAQETSIILEEILVGC